MSSMLVIAQLTLTRLARGRAVWASAIIAALPIAFAAILHTKTSANTRAISIDVVAFEMMLLAIIPPMFVASSVGEDIEDRTTTYVWSRPVPRWAVLGGKLLTLAPIAALLLCTSSIVAVYAGPRELLSAQTVISIAAGAIALSFVSAGLATLVPKHGMALTIAYMLFFDLPVGAMPISLANLSITHHVRAVSALLGNNPGSETSVLGGAIGLVVVGGIWLVVAVWRMRRLEA